MRVFLIAGIRIYRYLGSWLRSIQLPGVVYTTCKFHPTCSEYAELAIKKYGPAQGIRKAFVRVMRCNPSAVGGVDYP